MAGGGAAAAVGGAEAGGGPGGAEPDGAELCAAVGLPQSPPLCWATCSMMATIWGNAVGYKASPAQWVESALVTLLHAVMSRLNNFSLLALMAGAPGTRRRRAG